MATIAAIKIAQKQAGIPDAKYREILNILAGVKSSKDLDAHGRNKIYRFLSARNKSQRIIKKLFAVFYSLKPSLGDITDDRAWIIAFAQKANSLSKAPAVLDNFTVPQLNKAVEAMKHKFRQTTVNISI